ncbi:hypothetical protein SAMN05421595_2350 [Austwickia chelonae]|uniref:Uncharacterized protein n=1 Tax=Austwickia chelonae NBRC 105200 TaxID=1184607 RepID=K6UN54_9MICO|nr:hypothetical protein [Austwickia chelonae]GAB78696.1 hypothetical protein AUCHE_16_01160 [Austwickia chelonae NBRC 105200]SEW34793.1 hypothetical protein SAMN05421595_2350 [Austwickia chelonae]
MSGKIQVPPSPKGIPPEGDLGEVLTEAPEVIPTNRKTLEEVGPAGIYGSVLPPVTSPSADYELMPIAVGAPPPTDPPSLYGSVLPLPTLPTSASRYEQMPMRPRALRQPTDDGPEPESAPEPLSPLVEMISYQTGPLPRIVPAGDKVLPDYAAMDTPGPASHRAPDAPNAPNASGVEVPVPPPAPALHEDTSLWGFPPSPDQVAPIADHPIPRNIATATLLMKIMPVLRVIGVILSYVLGSFRGVFHTLQQGGQHEVSEAALTVAVTFVQLCTVIVLWWWMAVKNRQGYPWARQAYTLFFTLNVVHTAAVFVLVRHPLDVAAQLIYLALGAVILVLLFRPDSSDHYRRHRLST